MFDELKQKDIVISIDANFHNYLQQKNISFEDNISLFNDSKELGKVDYLISIGGDGTFLETIVLVKDNDIPVLGINTGRLGFLSNVKTDEIAEAIDALINKAYDIDERSMLSIEANNFDFGANNYALNEITLHRTDSSTMITVHTYLDDEFLNSYWADGLIISTPTGSTAYSLSCNGPILLPDSENMIITPIAPHNLNVRPLVINDEKVLKIQIDARSENYVVALDSRSYSLPLDATLKITKTPHTIKLIRLNNHTFLTTLRSKLMWGIDKRN
ncbi:MAG: inorganic polyphosphate kinase [Flavobacteriales bacterium BRH_c54]|nr:MAG: inorganic polyphosphate kinase [Flavobacteriales bacterium BRH_c54]